MEVYRIRNDVNRYQYFLTEPPIDLNMELDCKPKADTWSPPEVFIYMPLHERGDLFSFAGGTLILSPKATEVLSPLMTMAGELLPLPYKGETYTVFNVLQCIECLDHEKTEWVYGPIDGTRLHIQKYVFNPHRFAEPGFFKIPETYRAETLIMVNPEYDEEENVKALAEKHDLKGIIFERLWAL